VGAAAGVALALLLFLQPSAQAGEGRGKGRMSKELDQKIRSGASDDLISVIVQTTAEPSDRHVARMHGKGGAIKARHLAIRGYSARVPAAQIEALSEDPEVDVISYDTPVLAALDIAARAVRADVAFAESGGLDGTGVGIAMIDTGVAAHVDLLKDRRSGALPIEVEVVGHDKGLVDPFGHGTMVAGILNGNGAMSRDTSFFRTFKGLAPGARLISIRALQPDGSGRTSDVLTAIDWAIGHMKEFNIRVLNLSLGHPVYESYTTDPLCRAARAAVAAGIVVVVSAGNDGRVGSGFGTITSPANEPSVITVGAMDDSRTAALEDDVLAPYSSKGPTLFDLVVKPDIVAPGTRIVSLRAEGSFLDMNYHALVLPPTSYKSRPQWGMESDYFQMSGTSLAAPMVSAAAALMIQKDRSLTPATVKARLMRSAAKDEMLPFETGAGYLDVAAALQATGEAQSAFSLTASPMADGSIYIPDFGTMWGPGWNQGLIWGGRKTSGTTSTVSNDRVTSNGLIWGGGGNLRIESAVPTVSPEGLIWGRTVSAEGLIWGGGGN
jgi:serine protease AprX